MLETNCFVGQINKFLGILFPTFILNSCGDIYNGSEYDKVTTMDMMASHLKKILQNVYRVMMKEITNKIVIIINIINKGKNL